MGGWLVLVKSVSSSLPVYLFFPSLRLPQDNINDKWIWKHNYVEEYSLKDVYHILTFTDQLLVDNNSDLIWSKAVPLKVSLFACRTINKRIPTKDIFIRRGVSNSVRFDFAFGRVRERGNDQSSILGVRLLW